MDIIEQFYNMEPQKYWHYQKLDKEPIYIKLMRSGEYIARIKKDGEWARVINDNGNVTIQSRSVSVVTGTYGNKTAHYPHIVAWAQTLPTNTVILGELFWPGKTAQDVASIARCGFEKAVARQKEMGYIHFSVFDVLAYNGVSLMNTPAIERNNYFTLIKNQINVDYIECADAIFFNSTVSAEDCSLYIENLFKTEEGLVLERKNHIYEPGKRTAWNTCKIKLEDTYDMVISGFVTPTREYDGTELANWKYFENDEAVTKAHYMGWIAGFQFGAYTKDGVFHTIGTVSSGLSDEIKKDASEHPDKYLGAVIELQAMMKTKDGMSLRHPRFIRIREDKNAKGCIWND